MTLIASNNYCPFGIGKPLTGYDSQIPLIGVDVQANIIDNCGTCKVQQKYKNNYRSVIEAIYLFNLSSGDVVSSMSLTIGNRVLKSSILERTQARETYNEAKADGLTTCLLEKLPNNSYKMNVGNLDPGVEVTVEFTYLTITVCENDSFRFVLPTNIAPKYDASSKSVNDLLSAKDNKSLSYSVAVAYPVNISVRWISVNAITRVHSSTNELIVTPIGDDGNQVHISSVTAPQNGDFSLVVTAAFAPSMYTYTEPLVSVPTLALAPPAASTTTASATAYSYIMTNHRIPTEEGEEGVSTPKEYIFVLDRSGSMQSACSNWSGSLGSNTGGKSKMDHARAALKLFMESLPPNSSFNVVSFGSQYMALYNKSVPYSNENKNACLKAVDGFSANMGGTEIFKCLSAVLEGNIQNYESKVATDAKAKLQARSWVPGQPPAAAAVSTVGLSAGVPAVKPEKIIVLLTDGQVSNSGAVIDLCKMYNHLCRVFSIGIGADVDRNLVESVSRVSNGLSEVMVDSSDIDSVVVKMLDATSKVYYTDVFVKYHSNDSMMNESPAPIPTAAYEGTLYPNTVMSVFAKCPAAVLSELTGVTISATNGITGVSVSWHLDKPQAELPHDSGVAIKQLYANDLITTALKSPTGGGISKQEMVRLSIECDIMNELTSFVVVDTATRAQTTGGGTTVHVPQYSSGQPTGVRRLSHVAYSMAPQSIVGGGNIRRCKAPASTTGGRGGRGSLCRNQNSNADSFGFSDSDASSDGYAEDSDILSSSDSSLKKSAFKMKKGMQSQSQKLNSFPIPALDPVPAAPPPAPVPAHASGSAVSPYIGNMDALLSVRNTDGSFEYSEAMLSCVNCPLAQFTSLQSQLGAGTVVDAKLLFNILVMVLLEAQQQSKYTLILRNLKAWVSFEYAKSASGAVSLEQVVAEVVRSVIIK